MKLAKSLTSILLTLVLVFSSFDLIAAAESDEQTGTHFELLNPDLDSLSPEGDLLFPQSFNTTEIKSCGASTWGSLGLTNFISQMSITNTLSWALVLSPTGIAAFGPTVTVKAVNGSVTSAAGLTSFINGPNIYPPHTQPSTYQFTEV
ncbi:MULTISPECIES: hypothetical protein [unclassified Paenibacillus]|uniref:hypothetical protein n=1 Tax=unclassified Paenibacillus TaxID=185978 RepID=UPI002405BA24|nr:MULTISPECIES: hypothetical protein [unclassified Paenibacillus]MDF9839419.1 hypothetical protein [Paenibacillus sp. PastF-2]MDF9845999.1 hypothetical protein [Paenibacillus sp. PastM-2]MDF9852572.1 hypothetical protein [Paenibacillus sp. PastF-1]MDH6477698.1 hypothetical protein [Paenibacillus sp. PastH-2]MDH6505437.1 hypothetical protein [Paenibacillus sp. PastM-3]